MKLKIIAQDFRWITIPKKKIGAVIGSKGRVIQRIQNDTETFININSKTGVARINGGFKKRQRAYNAI